MTTYLIEVEYDADNLAEIIQTWMADSPIVEDGAVTDHLPASLSVRQKGARQMGAKTEAVYEGLATRPLLSRKEISVQADCTVGRVTEVIKGRKMTQTDEQLEIVQAYLSDTEADKAAADEAKKAARATAKAERAARKAAKAAEAKAAGVDEIAEGKAAYEEARAMIDSGRDYPSDEMVEKANVYASAKRRRKLTPQAALVA